MLRNNVRIAVRNIYSAGAFSIVNILGLTLGTLAFLISQQYVTSESDFDQFHKDVTKIFRLHNQHSQRDAIISNESKVYPGIGPELKRTFPEVESFVRFFSFDHAVCSYGDKKMEESNVLAVDASFADFFSFKFVEKSSASALEQPLTVVITKQLANKYLGVPLLLEKPFHCRLIEPLFHFR